MKAAHLRYNSVCTAQNVIKAVNCKTPYRSSVSKYALLWLRKLCVENVFEFADKESTCDIDKALQRPNNCALKNIFRKQHKIVP